MPENDRGIGSEGLEQGGPSLGNDYSRKDLGLRDAGDALTTPNTQGLDQDDQDTLDMDSESSRNLSGTADLDANSDLETDDLEDLDDLEDDDELLDLDDDDDDEDVELDKGL